MRMLCAVEPGTLVPPQPWRGAELFLLAAGVGVNAAKPHQGAASKKPAPHQGQIACNSTTALGLSWFWWSGTASGAGVTYDYDAWGNIFNQTGNAPNVYLYRGEQWDADLGLYYLRARYFNPVTGRFLSRDTFAGSLIDPGTLHKYIYAHADPVDRVDPTGMVDSPAGLLIFDIRAGGIVAFAPAMMLLFQPKAKKARPCGTPVSTQRTMGEYVWWLDWLVFGDKVRDQRALPYPNICNKGEFCIMYEKGPNPKDKAGVDAWGPFESKFVEKCRDLGPSTAAICARPRMGINGSVGYCMCCEDCSARSK